MIFLRCNFFYSRTIYIATCLNYLKGLEQTVYQQLLTINNTKVYKKEEIPEYLHYQNSRRIAPLILVADVGFQMCDSRPCEGSPPVKGIEIYLVIFQYFDSTSRAVCVSVGAVGMNYRHIISTLIILFVWCLTARLPILC